MKSIMEERHEPVTWEVFRRKFLSEYFPDNVKYAKEVEFLQLTRGSKSVAEYAEKFKHLSRFYTMPLDEEWRCRKFENDLRGDLRLMVTPLSIKDFVALVEMAGVMEKMKVEVETQHPHQQRVGGPSWSRHKHEERRNPILGLIPNLRGLGNLLPSMTGFSATSVGDHTRGMFAPNLQASRGATIVARKATLAEIAPPSRG